LLRQSGQPLTVVAQSGQYVRALTQGKPYQLLRLVLDVAFAARRPYLHTGPLREVLAYPYLGTQYKEDTLHWALECAGVAWLQSRLDDSEDWARVLPLRTQQRIGIARLFLQQPQWVFIEEATDAFDARDEMMTLERLHRELPNLTLLNISRHKERGRGFYSRHLELYPPDSGSQRE
jgi:putative ATP-binding cassette transporter